ncbi:hypothetical protein MA16_Dca020834 [Dendrobium catenatum]|uniref:HAT C-terminal dimerisation domain-containing protein n=1 Tax=Dendrobium catenatum TaxID=906689 RepID=A0A2I0VYS6_9ASPA|nr:hypothetical protein MA16_Dca020834 [Dendrobium catenatum]
MKDISDSYYAILVDESRDVSTKEQLTITVRYVDNLEQVVERFIGIKHVASTNTDLHHYCVEFFYTIIDMQLQELNNRFFEASTELLLCISCLNPSNSFSAYNKEKLIRLAELYSADFSIVELVALEYQLSTYILDMRTSEEFSSLESIADLAKQFVKVKKDIVYPLVHRLLVLALTVPIATATVERAFSAMKIVKHRLRSKMGDDWLNDSLVPYI